MSETDTVMSMGTGSLQKPEAGILQTEVPDLPAEQRQDVPFGPGDSVQTDLRQRTVPYGALAEERARRKELQRELQGAVEAQQRLQGRLDLLHELVQQRAAPAEDGTSESAAGSSEPQREGVEPSSITEVEARAQEQEQTGVAFRTQVMQSVREVMRERPDFLAAYRHARQTRISELRALGYTPHEALEITSDNELEVIRNAYANDRNPALVIYDYALRHGYRGGALGSVTHGAPGISRSSGVPSEAEKVALAARGQAGSKSLSAAGGGSTGTLSLEALASMSDEEFAEATRGDRWQKLLG